MDYTGGYKNDNVGLRIHPNLYVDATVAAKAAASAVARAAAGAAILLAWAGIAPNNAVK